MLDTRTPRNPVEAGFRGFAWIFGWIAASAALIAAFTTGSTLLVIAGWTGAWAVAFAVFARLARPEDDDQEPSGQA